jgi:hypothetical protein
MRIQGQIKMPLWHNQIASLEQTRQFVQRRRKLNGLRERFAQVSISNNKTIAFESYQKCRYRRRWNWRLNSWE